MHGEEDWGRGCRELGRQQPCPESFAAGEAPQPAGGRRQGKRAGDTALALGPPPRARAAPPRPEESAVSRIPRAPLWAVFILPPARQLLAAVQPEAERGPAAATPTDTQPRRPGRAAAGRLLALAESRPAERCDSRRRAPKRCSLRVRVPAARRGPGPEAPDKARRGDSGGRRACPRGRAWERESRADAHRTPSSSPHHAPTLLGG